MTHKDPLLCACGCGAKLPEGRRKFLNDRHQRTHSPDYLGRLEAKRRQRQTLSTSCACGCGQQISQTNRGRYRRYAPGHYRNAGSLGRMKTLLGIARHHAEVRRYAPPRTTAERMLVMWDSQRGLCAACGEPFGGAKIHFAHDHDTGVPRGFVHQVCNLADSSIRRFRDEALINFLWFYRPIIFKLSPPLPLRIGNVGERQDINLRS